MSDNDRGMPEQDMLDEIGRLADTEADISDRKTEVMRAAADAGVSLRRIAARARMSHESVRKLINQSETAR